LPESILMADFKRARKKIAAIDPTKHAGTKAQTDLGAALEQAIAGAGPTGWLDWILDLRNMLVH
jgi:hypothetical protein